MKKCYLQNKTVVISGASGGIGFSVAKMLIEKFNCKIIGIARNEKKILSAIETLGDKKSNFSYKIFDVSIRENWKNFAKELSDTNTKIDVLINNAQASASGVTIEKHTTEQFNLAMYSGLYATFYYMQACYPYLKETKGSVINFASGAGLFGNYGQCSYAAAKEAIRGLSRVAATEWGKDGINVNVVCPLAWTAQLEQFKMAYPDAFDKNVHMPPMGHFGDSEYEIGRVCVQLANPDFKYMTGETITLEGGLGLRP